MCSILVASNDLILERMLSVTLTINGFSVVSTKNLGEAISIMGNGKINMILVDQDVEKYNLDAFLDTMRGQKIDVPVLLIGEKKVGWENISKPVEFTQLKLKMNGLFRKKKSLTEKIIQFGDMKIDLIKKIVTIKDTFIDLGMMELAILVSLARKSGKVVARATIREDLEAQGLFFNRAIQHHISDLKKKLKLEGGENIKIKLMVGEGFKLTKQN